MRMLVLTAAAVTGLLPLATTAQNEELGVTLVHSAGTGTVYGVPTHVDFWIHREIEADSLEAATEKAEALEEELIAALAAAGAPRATLESSAPAVSDLEKKWAAASARLRFPIARFSDRAKAAAEFGALCDKVLAAAERIECRVRGPILDTTERDGLMKEAVKLAIENAYPIASAAAETLKSEFYTVDSLRIDAVRWNQSPDSERPEPNLEQVACTVQVTVTYAVTPKQ